MLTVKTLIIITLFSIVLSNSDGCKNTVPKLIDYSINPVPNQLDTVGVVFAIDSKGHVTPVGDLNLKTVSDKVYVPQEVDASHISFGLLLNFLNIKNLDSTTKVDASDTIKVNTNFVVTNGIQTRYDVNSNLLDAFNQHKALIADNIKLLGLETNKIYLILQTIKSDTVKITHVKTSHVGFDAAVSIKQLLKINPNVNVTNTKSSTLSYNLKSPLVVLYQLKSIKADLKRGEDGKIKLLLGEDVREPSIY